MKIITCFRLDKMVHTGQLIPGTLQLVGTVGIPQNKFPRNLLPNWFVRTTAEKNLRNLMPNRWQRLTSTYYSSSSFHQRVFIHAYWPRIISVGWETQNEDNRKLCDYFTLVPITSSTLIPRQPDHTQA